MKPFTNIRSLPITIVVGSCIAQLIDNITYTISFACLPHLFEDLQLASESQIGLVAAMFGIGGVLTSSLSGFVSDRLQSRKLPLVLGSIGYAICGCILFFSHKLWHLLLYRLLNGMASGLVYPISTAAVGDVYPHKLLGVQMALLNMFNNAGYMIGPIIGGALYDRAGVQGVSTVIITIGSALSLFMALGIKEPLLIHTRLLEQRGIESISDTESENKTIAEEIDSIDLYPKDMPLWRLVLKWQVMLASIITLSLGTFNSSLDNLLGMHVKDRFHISSSKAGLLYVINGGVSILLSIPTGTAVDRIIGRYGEDARGYIQVFGLLLACGSAFAIGMSKSFGMVAGLEAWIATAVLLVNIPVMSSFGDFVNRLNLNSMAQCYGIFNSFWSLSSTFAPPVATWLYTKIGFTFTVSGILSGLCLLCASMVLCEKLWKRLL
ncbi:major facilitator superfamily domain-containing protein [Coemansia mojavensis]|nr:major facilitator superfamily domain-containing protein [Coemansia mojavensis]